MAQEKVSQKELYITGGYPSQDEILFDEISKLVEDNEVFSKKVTSGVLLPTQKKLREFVFTPQKGGMHPVGCYLGAFGSGKSHILIRIALEACALFPGIHGLIGRETYEVLEDTLLYGKEGFCTYLDNNEIPYAINRKKLILSFANNSQIFFRSHDRPEKLGSYAFGFFGLDECSGLSEHFYDICYGRLRQKDMPHHFGFMVGNPPDENHWISKRFVEYADPWTAIMHASIFENPHLPESYVHSIVNAYRKDSPLYKKYVLGQIGPNISGKPAFGDVFRRELHVLKDLPPVPHIPMDCVWDFGYAMPMVIFAQCLGDTSTRYYRLFMKKKLFLEDFTPLVLKYRNEVFPDYAFVDYCDPHVNTHVHQARDTAFEILERFNIKPSYVYTGVPYGLDLINQRLSKLIGGKPAIQIADHPSMTLLIAALEAGYELDDEGEPVQDGYYEHPVDILRYHLVNRLGNVIQSDKNSIISKMQRPSYSFGGNRLASKDRKIKVRSENLTEVKYGFNRNPRFNA